MTDAELLFFNSFPELLPLYEGLVSRLQAAYPDFMIKVAKTQISFYNRHLFAMASLPRRWKKDGSGEYLIVSFGLGRPEPSPRIAARAEAYPGRWTHHVPVTDPGQMDEELFAWIDEAYQFALAKR